MGQEQSHRARNRFLEPQRLRVLLRPAGRGVKLIKPARRHALSRRRKKRRFEAGLGMAQAGALNRKHPDGDDCAQHGEPGDGPAGRIAGFVIAFGPLHHGIVPSGHRCLLKVLSRQLQCRRRVPFVLPADVAGTDQFAGKGAPAVRTSLSAFWRT